MGCLDRSLSRRREINSNAGHNGGSLEQAASEFESVTPSRLFSISLSRALLGWIACLPTVGVSGICQAESRNHSAALHIQSEGFRGGETPDGRRRRGGRERQGRAKGRAEEEGGRGKKRVCRLPSRILA
ncbi:uncharacterized protein BO80DRAFT_8546 [Aspergillus ibericus CBS 121593]|uniref:Uncharacterized protein n=1 Tax=Aspergillus ibericus CBS 121593 TaxID=1448316 RepID=A0A395HEM8_9EURO|nr:hypothetical protein BO80DRAFT_8546 [Aspergillus ibericus CBS 121593]RAL06322.1 hypothetical protein BO80DRAFT_8546 [Aspergillus ibericus CBS 121593]